MTTVSGPGWYPDPHTPTLMRWWDGSSWTDDTFERVEPVGGAMPAAGGAQAQGGSRDANPYVGQYGGQYGEDRGPKGAVTPDGVRIATWGRRVVARVIDILVAGAVTLLVSLPLLGGFLRRVREVSEQQAASGAFDPFALYAGATQQELVTVTVVGLVVNAVYEIAFLLWRRATPGKLLLGLRVRLLAAPQLPARAAVLRWATFVLPGQVPRVGLLWTVVDALSPLWDARRQALHDKVAGTCVVHPIQRQS